MADVNSLADMIQKASYLQAGGKPEGQRDIDKLNQAPDIINNAISNVLAIKKAQIDRQKGVSEIGKNNAETTEKLHSVIPQKQLDENGTSTVEDNLKKAQAGYFGRRDIQQPISVKLLPADAKARALAAGYTEDDFLEPKLFNAIKGTDPTALVPAMSSAQANAAGQVPGNTKITNEPQLTLGDRQDQFWQKQWTDLINKNDPATATSRSTLGLVGRANLQADRAIATLSKPTVTKQEAGNVMADIAGIYQGGAPTQFGMQEQGYKTLYGSLQNALQSITGSPTDVLPNDIKSRLMSVLGDMKKTNSSIINDRLNRLEKTQPNIIKHFPDEWKDFKNSFNSSATVSSIPSTVTPSQSPKPGGVENQDAQGNRAWVYPDGTFDEIK